MGEVLPKVKRYGFRPSRWHQQFTHLLVLCGALCGVLGVCGLVMAEGSALHVEQPQSVVAQPTAPQATQSALSPQAGERTQSAQPPSASIESLMKHVDGLWRGDTSHAIMSMTVTTARYQRTLSLEAWSKGIEHSLVVIRQPKKDRGVATLKVAANIWNYLPRIDRVTKIPSSMMSGAWMGSHFTNDDLVKESTYSEDYTAELMDSASLPTKVPTLPKTDNRVLIRATPKPNAHVVWGHVDLWLDDKEFYPIKILYYDEAGVLVRTLFFDQVAPVAGRSIPLRLRLQPESHPDESTVIVYEKIVFDVPLSKRFFSLQNLKNRN
jgi:hypothetical protein